MRQTKTCPFSFFIWVKITNPIATAQKQPELTSPLDSFHKKPFERLWIFEILGEERLKQAETNDVETELIFATPSQFHSMKPFLHEFLVEKLDSKKPIELFSRRVVGNGWTNWGNECLSFNEVKGLGGG